MLGASLLEQYIAASGSRAKLAEVTQRMLEGFHQVGDRAADSRSYYSGYIVDNRLIAAIGIDEKTALDIRDGLDELAGMPLGPDGDKYVQGKESLLFKIAAGPSQSETFIVLAKPTFFLPDTVISLMYQHLRGFAMVWHRAT